MNKEHYKEFITPTQEIRRPPILIRKKLQNKQKSNQPTKLQELGTSLDINLESKWPQHQGRVTDCLTGLKYKTQGC